MGATEVFQVEQIATIGAIWSVDSSSAHPYLPVNDALAVKCSAVHCNVQGTSEARPFKSERGCVNDRNEATPHYRCVFQFNEESAARQ